MVVRGRVLRGGGEREGGGKGKEMRDVCGEGSREGSAQVIFYGILHGDSKCTFRQVDF